LSSIAGYAGYKRKYPASENNGAYPKTLLQVFIRQGSGQIHDYAAGNRKETDLFL
jgi:hypothetical protein